MSTIKAAPQVTLPKPPDDAAADTGFVDIFAVDTSASTFERDSLSVMRADERPIDHPLFRNGQGVIAHADREQPWMRHNAVQMLGLCGVSEANESLPVKLHIAAIFDRNSREIRKFELRPNAGAKMPGECLLSIRCTREFLLFDEVNAAGLTADVAGWFDSLVGQRLKKSLYRYEVHSQRAHNQDAFRTFYQSGLEGLPPEFYSRLHAWIALESGRILCVSGSPRPTEKNHGVPTLFGARVEEDGAAYLQCRRRSSLLKMPIMYLPYFGQPLIKVRDVVPQVETEVDDFGVDVDIEVLSGDGSDMPVDDSTGGIVA